MSEEALVAQYRAGNLYCKRLKEAGLWDARGYDIDLIRKKYQIQAEVYEEFADVELPMFCLEKAETHKHMQELAEQWVEEHSGLNTLTVKKFWDGVYGRPNHDRDYPDLLLTLVEEDCLTEKATRKLLAEVWMQTEFPGVNGGNERWLDAFDAAGWVSDNKSERPTTPMTLYRGAVEDHKIGLAWTADPERAAWFAKRFNYGDDVGKVYRRIFQPHELLARFTGRNEDEYVCWTRDLMYEEDDGIEEIVVAEQMTTCAKGHEHWGMFGAAGVLLVQGEAGTVGNKYLLHKRAPGTHEAGYWSTPGGAVRMGEPALTAARREFQEETGIDVSDLKVLHTHVDDHGGWMYRTYLMDANSIPAAIPTLNWESGDWGWFTAEEGCAMDLHSGLRELWGWTPLDPI
jgi:8-oxo-dGTP pyrophosphatase MutT (NUDIX family)